jgi:hypothetical protein
MLMFRKRKRILLLGLLALVWLATSACACSDLLAPLGERDSTPQPTATPTRGLLTQPQRELSATAQHRTATLTRTPRRTPTATPTRSPSRTSAPAPTSEQVDGIPSTPNTAFDVILTEEQVNDYVAGQVVSEGGVQVSDAQVTLADGEALVHLSAYHEASNLRLGLTVRGAPVVYEGGLYVRVDDVTLDDSVRGLARLLARTVIDAALAQYTGEHGIAIPIEQVTLESVDVTPGQVRIVGRTR